MTAMRRRQCGLFRRSHGPDDRRAQVVQPLAGDEADAPGGGMEQDRVTGLHVIGSANEVFGGHALEHHRRALLGIDGLGQLDQPVGGDHPRLGIGTGRSAGIGNAVARG
jgi:hypothetical protein